MNRILIIDEDVEICRLLERFLTRHNFRVQFAITAQQGLAEIKRFTPDVILYNFNWGDTKVKNLLIQIKEIHPTLPVIVMTDNTDIKMAVKVMKQGAFDYIAKPLSLEEMLATIKKSIHLSLHQPGSGGKLTLLSTSTEQQSHPNKNRNDGKYIFGKCPEFKNILKEMDLVAPTNYTVIIYGESGSGKEAIAQEIHMRSKRKEGPFMAIDCGALSKELAGSELFGHEIGSFTGALNQKKGSLELAKGGTVFLDEVSNLPYGVQVSLLRVVQERKMRRVGGNCDIELDIRIIVASNENLWELTKIGKFREDLYHRFNEFSISIPPLRERKEDIMTFAHFFLAHANQELNTNILGFSQDVQEIFKCYSWPGNLRELKNVVKRASLLTEGDCIHTTALPFEVANPGHLSLEAVQEQLETKEPTVSSQEDSQGFDITILDGNMIQYEKRKPLSIHDPSEIGSLSLKAVSVDAEYELILEALRKANYNKVKAARYLKIDRKTLYNKMRLYNDFEKLKV